MKKRLSFLANGLWAASSLPEALLFERAASRVEETQREWLRRCLRRNEKTLFGREHGFSEITSFEDFREKVPLASYENFLPYLEKIAKGEKDLLFPGKPIRFEPTSGSASATKNIPYNSELKKQFQAGLAPWIADLFKNLPASMKGRAYWSISPASIGEKFTEGGIPVGFEDDTEYLGPMVRRLMGEVLAVPSLVAKLKDIEDVRYVTLLFLLAAEDLSLISIWNPTFLTLLLQPLGEGLSRICEDLARGKISLSLPEEIRNELEKTLGLQPRRAREIREIFEEKRDSPELFGSLWPHLALISCWTEASAYGPFLELGKKFPGVRIQPKGLLATEGIVTFPLLNHGAALCLRSHFFEFLPEQGEKTLSAWEIEEGGIYSLVMTTGGGLYRYSLGDKVEVTGFYKKCTLLRFLGKGSKVSDLYGEKLNEAHVAEVLRKKFVDLALPSFSLLAPEGAPPDRYLLYLAGEKSFSPEEMRRASRLLEEGLQENVHYAYCRTLGQLKEAEIRWVEGGAARAFGIYQEVCLERGQKAGDIKSSFLDKQPIWNSRFFFV